MEPLDELVSIKKLPKGINPIGAHTDEEGNRQVSIQTPIGRVRFGVNTKFRFLGDGSVLVLESYGSGTTVRYKMTSEESHTDFIPVYLAPDEVAQNVLQWGDRYVNVIRKGDRTILRTTRGSGRAFTTEFRGILEEAWHSPDERSIAWLTRKMEDGRTIRSLVVNGRLFYSGEFSVVAPPVWSPDEESFGIAIHQPQRSGTPNVIVATNEIQEVPANHNVREFLVDDNGRVAARITDDGVYARPRVYNSPHDAQLIAWNLHWKPGKSIGYNSVSVNVVMRHVDETHLRAA